MPAPPPDPPNPDLSPPAGDIAREPAPPFPGTPTLAPGLLETTIPFPPPLPPPALGGATADPRSLAAPAPVPLAPSPRPETEVPSPIEGGGGTIFVLPRIPPTDCVSSEREPSCTGGAIIVVLPRRPPTVCPMTACLPAWEAVLPAV